MGGCESGVPIVVVAKKYLSVKKLLTIKESTDRLMENP